MITYSYRQDRRLPLNQLIALYRANEWSSAEKGETLKRALLGSHSLVTVWSGKRLVGLGNAISDGFLVVYYPHLIVHPKFQGKGIGAQILKKLKKKYEGFHQHMLIADKRAVGFYKKCGFVRAGKMSPMWIYAGDDY